MKIQYKLFLVLFAFSLLLVGALVISIQWTIGKGMVEYVNTKQLEQLKPLIPALANVYSKNHNWNRMQAHPKSLLHLIESTKKGTKFNDRPPSRKRPPTDMGKGRPKSGGPPQRGSKGDSQVGLLNAELKLIVGPPHLLDSDYSKVEILVDKKVVGYLVVPKRHKLKQGFELEFIKRQQGYLWIIGVIVLLISALVTLPFAKHLVTPIKRLASGMTKLGEGDYQQKIEINNNDELGELSRDFNKLVKILSDNDLARKRWLANTSHELRTPLAIMLGELEAMLDEVRPMNKKNIESVTEEVKHLQRLINDLHQLTSSDIGAVHYNKQLTELNQFLADEHSKYQSFVKDSGMLVHLSVLKNPVFVDLDFTRFSQVLHNLMSNSVKYSQGKNLWISTQMLASEKIQVKIEDDGIGVEDNHLPNLFEYLYRVEDSRNRKTGGSGLGLAICVHIIEAHDGKIKAQKSERGGLSIIIDLPISHVE